MRTPFRSFPGIPALVLALAASACAGGDEADEAAPADTAAMEETDAATDGSAGVTPSVASISTLSVSNPMPHAMVVRVAYEGGGEAELGMVPANGDVTFDVSASPGETVTVRATDEGDTHTVEQTLTLEAENSWTIQ